MKKKLSYTANFIFWQTIFIGLLMILVFVSFAVKLYPFFPPLVNNFSQKLALVCGCANHWQLTNHPFIFSLLIGSGSLILGAVTFALIKITGIVWRTRRFIRYNLKEKKTRLSFKLFKIVQQIGLLGQISEINKKEPIIFCYGFIRPRICLSSGISARLNEEELRAVLLHEKQHLLSRVPLKIFVVRFFSVLFFFLPAFKILVKKYLTYAELSADERATSNFREKMPLARALCKIIKWKESLLVKEQLALSFFDQVTEERVNRLTDENYIPKIKILNWRSLFNAALLFSTLLVFWSTFKSPQWLQAKEEANLCAVSSTVELHDPPSCQKETPGGSCVIKNYYSLDFSDCVH